MRQQSITLLVLRGLNYDVLLGSDTLQRYGAIIDYRRQRCTLRVPARTPTGILEVELPMLDVDDGASTTANTMAVHVRTLALRQKFVIPPNSSVDLPVFATDAPSSAGTVMIEPLSAGERSRISGKRVADGIVTFACGLAQYGTITDYSDAMGMQTRTANMGWKHMDTSQQLKQPGCLPLRARNFSDQPLTVAADTPLATAHFVPENHAVRINAVKSHPDDELRLPFAKRGEVVGRLNGHIFEAVDDEGKFSPLVDLHAQMYTEEMPDRPGEKWSAETDNQPTKSTPDDEDNAELNDIAAHYHGHPQLPQRARAHAFRDEEVITPYMAEERRPKLLPLLRKHWLCTAQTYGACDPDYFHLRLDQHTPGVAYSAPRRQSLQAQAVVIMIVDELLAAQKVKPCISAYNAPIVIAMRSDSTPRFCIDYRQINGLLIQERHPIPTIDRCIDVISGAARSTLRESRSKAAEMLRTHGPALTKTDMCTEAHAGYAKHHATTSAPLSEDTQRTSAGSYAVSDGVAEHVRADDQAKAKLQTVKEFIGNRPEPEPDLRNTVFSSLDARQGFHTIPIHPDDQHKLAFSSDVTPQMTFTHLPFGLSSGSSAYQRLMDQIFQELLRDHTVCVYIDDIAVASPDFETHLRDLDRVLTALDAAGICLKLKKCLWASNVVKFCGFVVGAKDGEHGVWPMPSLVLAIQNKERPKNKKEVMSVLGLFNFYRKYVPNFSLRAQPLTQLTCGDDKWTKDTWNPECERAFTTLKEAITNDSFLVAPDFTRKLQLRTDASKYAIGAVLGHADDPRPIAYASAKLNKAERNYGPSEREALCCVHMMEYFRTYLQGKHFELVTDCSCLKYLLTTKASANPRLARWALACQAFSFDVRYRPGKDHGDADGLSRLPLDGSDFRDRDRAGSLEQECEILCGSTAQADVRVACINKYTIARAYTLQKRLASSDKQYQRFLKYTTQAGGMCVRALERRKHMQSIMAGTHAHNRADTGIPDKYFDQDLTRRAASLSLESFSFDTEPTLADVPPTEVSDLFADPEDLLVDLARAQQEVCAVAAVIAATANETCTDDKRHARTQLMLHGQRVNDRVNAIEVVCNTAAKCECMARCTMQGAGQDGGEAKSTCRNARVCPIARNAPARAGNRCTPDPALYPKVAIIPLAHTTLQSVRVLMRAAQQQDAELAAILALLSDDQTSMPAAQQTTQVPRLVRLFGDAFQLANDGVLMFQQHTSTGSTTAAPRMVVPRCYRQQVFDLYHGHAQSGGHYGYDRMLHTVRTRFFWLSMCQDLRNMCQACPACSQRNRGAGGTLHRTVQERPIEPFDRMVVDVLGPLRPTKLGNRYLLIFLDVASRWVIPVPTPTYDAEATARILIQRVWCEYGTLPRVLLSDQGSNFTAQIMQAVYRLLGVSKVEGTAYNPSTQGMVERYNDTFAMSMSKYISIHHDDWDQITPLVSCAYKTSTHTRNKCSPFKYLFGGIEPRLPADLPFEDEQMQEARRRFPTVEEAWRAIESWRTYVTDLSRDRLQRQYNIAGKPTKARKLTFKPGEAVMINRTRAKKGQSKKFISPWRGPFIVLRTTKLPNEYILAVATADSEDFPTKTTAGELRWSGSMMKRYATAQLPPETQRSFEGVQTKELAPASPVEHRPRTSTEGDLAEMGAESGKQGGQKKAGCIPGAATNDENNGPRGSAPTRPSLLHRVQGETQVSGAKRLSCRVSDDSYKVDVLGGCPEDKSHVSANLNSSHSGLESEVSKATLPPIRKSAAEVVVGDVVAFYTKSSGLVRGKVVRRTRNFLTVLFEDRSVEIRRINAKHFVGSEEELTALKQWCSAELPLRSMSLAEAIGHRGTERCRSEESDRKIAVHFRVVRPDDRELFYPKSLAEHEPWRGIDLRQDAD